MDQSEKMLLIAATGYSRSHNVSLTKISWALASILQKPESNVYHTLKDIDIELDNDLQKMYGERVYNFESDDESEEIHDDFLENMIGEIVDVQVLDIKTFGAVCRVENTTRTLLLHISEIANEFIDDVEKYLKRGDKLKAMLTLNPKGELGLSIKRLRSVKAEDDYKDYKN